MIIVMNATQTLSEKVIEICRPIWDELVQLDPDFPKREDMNFEEFCLEVEIEFAMIELEAIGALTPPLVHQSYDFYREDFPADAYIGNAHGAMK